MKPRRTSLFQDFLLVAILLSLFGVWLAAENRAKEQSETRKQARGASR